MMITILIIPIVLCFVVVAILPVHEADAKECNSDKNDRNKNNNKADTHSTTCIHQQDSSNRDQSTTITTKKDNTPFILSLPFP
jgi:hypothetical protein